MRVQGSGFRVQGEQTAPPRSTCPRSRWSCIAACRPFNSVHRCLRLHITFKFTGPRCVNLPQIDIPSGLQRLGLPIANSSHQPPASTEELSVKVTKPNPRDLVTRAGCVPLVSNRTDRECYAWVHAWKPGTMHAGNAHLAPSQGH